MKPFLSLLLLFCLARIAWGALPPLTQQELDEGSTDIVVATVLNVKTGIQEVPGGDDRVYELSIRVEEVRKGTLRAGLTLPVIARQTGRRPEGWAGPQGQNEIPGEKSNVRLYLREEQNRFFSARAQRVEPSLRGDGTFSSWTCPRVRPTFVEAPPRAQPGRLSRSSCSSSAEFSAVGRSFHQRWVSRHQSYPPARLTFIPRSPSNLSMAPR